MFIRPFVVTITLFVAVLTYHPVAAQSSAMMSSDSSATVYTFHDDDQLLDTVLVIRPDRPAVRVLVNKYVEVNEGIWWLQHRYLVGFWSLQVTQGSGNNRTTTNAGIWKGWVSVPTKGTRLVLRRRNGTVADITPKKK